jgi:hypothetical protein
VLNGPGCSTEATHNNQDSGRSSSDPLKDLIATTIIPHDVFYEANSFQPLPIVDLSDWTELITSADSPITTQITSSLSPHCVQLNLTGCSSLSASKGAL